MLHRHLNHSEWTLATIDDVAERALNLIVPLLLTRVWALINTLQMPAAKLFGSLTTTCVRSELGIERTSAADTSKI